MKSNRKTFGIIIIGNEILSGKTLDTNSHLICTELNNVGMVCKEIVTIPDIEKIISKKVNLFRQKFDYVFTTGGIGPTHDDKTSRAVSGAFGDTLELNEEAKKRLEKHYSDDVLTNARLKMAYVPSKAKLIDNPISIAPGFYLENVFVFPGVPKILEVMLIDVLKKFKKNQKQFIKKTITTTLSEGIIGEYVESVQKKFFDLEIGSYPYFKKNSFGVSLVITGECIKRVKQVCDLLTLYLEKNNGNPRLF
jgi:molybdenum cofactor synthesis domain-containing protein